MGLTHLLSCLLHPPTHHCNKPLPKPLMGGTRKIPHFLSQKKGDALISDLHRFSDSVEPSVCDFMFHVFDALEFQISLHAFCCVLFYDVCEDLANRFTTLDPITPMGSFM